MYVMYVYIIIALYIVASMLYCNWCEVYYKLKITCIIIKCKEGTSDF